MILVIAMFDIAIVRLAVVVAVDLVSRSSNVASHETSETVKLYIL